VSQAKYRSLDIKVNNWVLFTRDPCWEIFSTTVRGHGTLLDRFRQVQSKALSHIKIQLIKIKLYDNIAVGWSIIFVSTDPVEWEVRYR
jgi:hypothetical protein